MIRYGVRVQGLLCRLVGDAALAEDLAQETWASIWTALPRLRRERDAWPYIRRTAVRKSWDRWRGQPELVTGADPEPVVPSSTKVGLSLSRLPPSWRAALVLYYWEGLSVAEIAQVLETAPGTVKTWMFRARGQLRRDLQLGERDA